MNFADDAGTGSLQQSAYTPISPRKAFLAKVAAEEEATQAPATWKVIAAIAAMTWSPATQVLNFQGPGV